jgi:anti-sigma factor RsiW
VSCQENAALIHGYLDGELDLVHNLQVEDHLRECATYAQTYRNLQALRSAVRSGGLYFKPPEDLAARVHLSLQKAEGVGLPAITAVREAPTKMRHRSWQAAAALAAGLALVAVLAYRFAPGASRLSQGDLVVQEVLASNVRSLLADHLTDVPSSDQHTVKPWFNGKLDFSPPVRDLSQQGFPLAGGRLDYVDERPVAALVYQRRKHLINLFVWPSSEKIQELALMRQGYNMHHWAEAGMTFWAVSDLNNGELEEFVRLVRTHP